MSLCVCKERARRCLAFSSTEGNINYSCRENVQPVCACVFRFSPGARARLFLNVMHNGHVIIDTINIRCTPCNIYTYCTMHIIGNTSKVCVWTLRTHTYICICICIYDMYMYVHTWHYTTRVRTYMKLYYRRTCIRDIILYTYVRIWRYITCTYIHVWNLLYVYMYVCLYICICIRTHVCTDTYVTYTTRYVREDRFTICIRFNTRSVGGIRGTEKSKTKSCTRKCTYVYCG